MKSNESLDRLIDFKDGAQPADKGSSGCHVTAGSQDMSFTHPQDLLLSAQMEDHFTLDTLRVHSGGEQRPQPDVKKYICDLKLDPNTANRKLKLSLTSRNVRGVTTKRSYYDHPDRFDSWPQVLCTNAVSDRCYWEAEWENKLVVGVTYRGIRRKGDGNDSWLGGNDRSWSLFCSDYCFSVCHNNKETVLPLPSSSSYGTVAVYVDYPNGTLSFYRVSSGTPILLYTFNTTFTEPVYPAFGFGLQSSLTLGSTGWRVSSICAEPRQVTGIKSFIREIRNFLQKHRWHRAKKHKKL